MSTLVEFARPDAEIFVPDGRAEDEALGRITHLCIGAHPDDVELMAYHGIRAGQGRDGPHFGAVTCTDGAGAARTDDDDDANSDADVLRRTRRDEQRAAARRGRYSAAIQLGHSSESVRAGVTPEVVQDLARVLDATRPRVIYTHSPTDIHSTHVGVCVAAIEAIRTLPQAARPAEVLGCEVWGSLDWLPQPALKVLDLGDDASSWSALIQVFASQTRLRPYHEGALGRSRANAVFRDADAAGGHERHWLAMDLTPLAQDDGLGLEDWVRERIAGFESAALGRIAAARGQ